MWFHFPPRWEWQNVLPGSHLGLEETLVNWMRSKQFRYHDSEEHLQRSGCSSVVHWQVPLNSVVLIWFIPVTEVPCKPWVICLCCLCQVSKPVDLNFQWLHSKCSHPTLPGNRYPRSSVWRPWELLLYILVQNTALVPGSCCLAESRLEALCHWCRGEGQWVG